MVNRVRRLISCVRYREVLILQGPPVVGGLLAMGEPTDSKWAVGAVFLLANFCLVAHVWSFNDWADRHADGADARKAMNAFTRKGVSPSSILALSLALMAAGLVLFAILGGATFAIAVGITALGFAYSIPGLHAKGIVVLSSLVHLAGGFLHFLLGYSLFAPIGAEAVQIATVFALVFTAGHGVQEIQDHDSDRRAGVSTNAVVFGKRAVFWATLVAFIAVYGSLTLFTVNGVFPPPLGPICLALGVFHLILASRVIRAGLCFERVQRYRAGYRALFALLCLSLGVCVFAARDATNSSPDESRYRVQGVDKGQVLAERVAR